jgi:deoxyribodipyrimidine photolyase
LCHASGWGLFLYERTKPLSKIERLEAAYKASATIWKRKYDEQKKVVDTAHNKKLAVRSIVYIKQRPWLLALVRRVKKVFV